MAPVASSEHAAHQASHAVEVASSQATSAASRLSRWVEDNKNLAIALGIGTVVASGAGAYYYFGGPSAKSSPRRPKAPSSAPSRTADAEKGVDTAEFNKDSSQAGASATAAAAASAAKSKKKKKGKKTTSGGGGSTDDALKSGEGPLLEEASDESLFQLSPEEIAKLPKERRTPLAQALKAQGNKAYASRSFQQAIDLYTKAIAAQPQAVFYSNRAACYSNIGRHRDVIADCNSALETDPAYVKALNRRANAQEQVGSDADGDKPGPELEEKKELLYKSLCDFTAVAILGGFADTGATESVERVLKKLAAVKAREVLRTREPKLPSPTFVTAYLEAFRKKPLPQLPDNPSQADQTLLLAYQALEARDYSHASSLFNAAVEQGASTDELKSLAYNMRGTFRFIIGQAPEALEDLNHATDLQPSYVQSWVKKASVHMELGDKDEAFADFDQAIKASPEDPDIFYHRGQVHFILGQYTDAMADYDKSTHLDGTFIFSQVQHAVAQYKLGKISQSTSAFRGLLQRFAESSEAFNYYGELLLDQQKFEDAMQNFDRAIEIEAAKDRSRNVLPMINKALALFQWKQDMAAAERLCREALNVDEDCDVAVATLAQLSLQQGKLPEAIEWFRRSAQIARTEPELNNALTYENASLAQLQFIKDFPEQGAALSAMAGGQ